MSRIQSSKNDSGTDCGRVRVRQCTSFLALMLNTFYSKTCSYIVLSSSVSHFGAQISEILHINTLIMDQKLARSEAAASWTSDRRAENSSAINSPHSPSKARKTPWTIKTSVGLSQNSMSPINESPRTEGGWTPIPYRTPRKPSAPSGPATQHRDSWRPGPGHYLQPRQPSVYQATLRSNFSVSPPSAAAVSRASAYIKRPCESEAIRSLANKSKQIPKEYYKPGMIIRAALHEQDLNARNRRSEITEADRFRSETRFGTIFTKYRKMIVVEKYEDHYIALPLYTHNGKGLEWKARPEEYVSIKDHRQKGDFKPLSRHPALVTEAINDGIDPFDAKSTAHLTYTVSRNYNLPVVHEGQLTRNSFKLLIDLFGQFIPKLQKH